MNTLFFTGFIILFIEYLLYYFLAFALLLSLPIATSYAIYRLAPKNKIGGINVSGKILNITIVATGAIGVYIAIWIIMLYMGAGKIIDSIEELRKQDAVERESKLRTQEQINSFELQKQKDKEKGNYVWKINTIVKFFEADSVTNVGITPSDAAESEKGAFTVKMIPRSYDAGSNSFTFYVPQIIFSQDVGLRLTMQGYMDRTIKHDEIDSAKKNDDEKTIYMEEIKLYKKKPELTKNTVKKEIHLEALDDSELQPPDK